MNKLFKLSALKGFSNQRQLFVKRFYCANNQSSTAEPRIVPVTLSYNSYENIVSDSNASPVIIMHGNFILYVILDFKIKASIFSSI